MPNLSKEEQTDGVRLDRLEHIINRDVPLPALDAFEKALGRSTSSATVDHSRRFVAIAFDASALLRVNRGKNASDTLDYLSTKHPVPAILPGQAIQEFWNNQTAVVETQAKRITKAFGALSEAVSTTDPGFSTALEQLQENVNQFHSEYREVYDEATIQDTQRLIDIFRSNGIVKFVPRLRFAAYAEHRKATKTPPGFRDPGVGDLFVWLDTLYALLELKERLPLEGLAFITQDVKSDWQRGGVAHPTLASELRAVVDVPLEFWTVDQLHAYVQTQIAT